MAAGDGGYEGFLLGKVFGRWENAVRTKLHQHFKKWKTSRLREQKSLRKLMRVIGGVLRRRALACESASLHQWRACNEIQKSKEERARAANSATSFRLLFVVLERLA